MFLVKKLLENILLQRLVKVLEDLNIEDTGKCFDFNALEIYP